MDPRAIDELFPDWRERGAPLNTQVTEDRFYLLTEKKAYFNPHWLLPDCFVNDGYYIVSLANVVRWLAKQAEELGVEIFAGFPASRGAVRRQGRGARRGDGQHGRWPGRPADRQLPARRGAPGQVHPVRRRRARPPGQAGDRAVPARRGPRSADLGHRHQGGLGGRSREARARGSCCTAPAGPSTARPTAAVSCITSTTTRSRSGLVVGLGYTNPYLEPFQEFQRYKTHPTIRAFLEGGKRVAYGARAINASGLQSLPKLVFPGGALVGCDAGFLNAPRIKGSHAAIKTGHAGRRGRLRRGDGRPRARRACCLPGGVRSELAARRAPSRAQLQAVPRPGPRRRRGAVGRSISWSSAAGRRGPCTARNPTTRSSGRPPSARRSTIRSRIGQITFDKPSSVYLSNTNHEENQPAHLTLKDAAVPVSVNLARYAGPEARYCPAGVYEFVADHGGSGQRLQINFQNCVHCKTCDIKDPTQNIVWVDARRWWRTQLRRDVACSTNFPYASLG